MQLKKAGFACCVFAVLLSAVVHATQVTAGALSRIDRLLNQESIDDVVSHGEATEKDDDGYQQIAEAALREGAPATSGAAQISDRTLRAIVAKRVREARIQHRVMKQFVKDFARNLKLSVLEDSKGDMPEQERLADIAKLKKGEDIPAPPAKRHLNMHGHEQLGHHQRHHHHHHKHSKQTHQVRMLNGRRHHRRNVTMQSTLTEPVQARSVSSMQSTSDGMGTDAADTDRKDAVAALLAEQRQEDLESERAQAAKQKRRRTMEERREEAVAAEAAGCGPLPCAPSEGVELPVPGFAHRSWERQKRVPSELALHEDEHWQMDMQAQAHESHMHHRMLNHWRRPPPEEGAAARQDILSATLIVGASLLWAAVDIV